LTLVIWVALAGCAPGGGETGAAPSCGAPLAPPLDLDGLVGQLAGWSPPITLPCVLSALPRPLGLEATSDVFSVQPAVGGRSPRLFVQVDQLVITVVPEGSGADLMEFGSYVDGDRSLKGELAFPIEAPVTAESPYERLLSPFHDGSSCGVCHPSEEEVSPGRFVSIALRPIEGSLVPIEDVAAEAAACDRSVEPERCAILDAVFGHGEVVHQPLPASWPTIY
jgi:hypothetical protein